LKLQEIEIARPQVIVIGKKLLAEPESQKEPHNARFNPCLEEQLTPNH
jgi:hypothetical protein